MQSVLILVGCAKCDTSNRMVISSRNRTPPRCGKCKTLLFEQFTVIFGFVYILSNPAMPKLVKIGHTLGSLKARVSQLSAGTGIPKPFEVEAYFLSERPKDEETRIHISLRDKRHKGREFFTISIPEAIRESEKIVGRSPQYVRSLNGSFKEP